jgi:enoyl-CoA hydratase/carnithine racemase
MLVGLVAEVVPGQHLERRALETALALARLPREQAALLKLAIWEGLELPMRDAIALERRLAERYKMISAPLAEPSRTSHKRAKSTRSRLAAPRRTAGQ